MLETVLISVYHPAFSFLLHENVKSEFDQVSENIKIYLCVIVILRITYKVNFWQIYL